MTTDEPLKIVTWNCRCVSGKEDAFIKKLKEIVKIGADVYVIQECPNPDNEKIQKALQDDCGLKSKDEQQKSFWAKGKNGTHGVGIFVKKEMMNVQKSDKINVDYKCYVSCDIKGYDNENLKILGIWANTQKSGDYPKNLWEDLLSKIEIDDNCIIAGDLNTDKNISSQKQHIDATENIYNLFPLDGKKRLISAYHWKFEGEEYGAEERQTHYPSIHETLVENKESLAKIKKCNEEKTGIIPLLGDCYKSGNMKYKTEKGSERTRCKETFYQPCKKKYLMPKSHVDYIFANKGKIEKVELQKPEDWLKYSDHLPLYVELAFYKK